MKFYICEIIKILSILWIVLGIGNIGFAFYKMGSGFGLFAIIFNIVCYFIPGAILYYICDKINV